MSETVKESAARYMRAAHAMQSGVAFMLEHDEKIGTPKDLRVGVNSAMVEHGALAKMLIDRGLFTMEEYSTAQADAMEREVERIRADIKQRTGLSVNLI